jgi:hypothetical protein
MFETKGNTTRHLRVDWVASQLAGGASQCGAGALVRGLTGLRNYLVRILVDMNVNSCHASL